MTEIFPLLAQGVWQRVAENDFYQYALAGGIAVALVCSVLSVFVVFKRMAFVGEGISHAAFGGIGVALLAGLAVPEVRPALARDGIVAVFCVATAVGIGYLSRRGKVSEDTAIGICLVSAMAAGVLLLDLRAHWMDVLTRGGQLDRTAIGYTPSLENILFGNILLSFSGPAEVALPWVLAVLVVGAVAALFKELVFFTFDEETAEVFGVRTNLLYYGLLVALGLAIVAAMRTMGVILVSALLILPGAAGRYWSGRIGIVTLISAALGVGGLAGGLLLAIYLEHFSPEAIIVLTLAAIFVLSALVHSLRRRRT